LEYDGVCIKYLLVCLNTSSSSGLLKMLSRFSILVYLCLLANSSYAADLLTTLRNSNATLFADVIEADSTLSAIFLGPNVRTVFAPVDSVLASIPPSRRALQLRDEAQEEQKKNSYHTAEEQSNASTERSPPGGELTTGSDKVPSRRGHGKKQAIVLDNGLREGSGGGNERRQAGAPPSLKFFTGLGDSVTVLQSGIEYDGGSIYTIDG
jgi:hypothetical protein